MIPEPTWLQLPELEMFLKLSQNQEFGGNNKEIQAPRTQGQRGPGCAALLPLAGHWGLAAAPAPPELPRETQLGRVCQRLRMCEAAGMTVGSWRSGWGQGWGLERSSMEGLHLWELGLAHGAGTLSRSGRECLLEAEEGKLLGCWGLSECWGSRGINWGTLRMSGMGEQLRLRVLPCTGGGPQCSFPTCDFQDSISLLLEAVRTKNEELAQTWKKSEQWATIEQLCSKRGVPGVGCPSGRWSLVPWQSCLGVVWSCSQAVTEASGGSWGGSYSLVMGSWNGLG